MAQEVFWKFVNATSRTHSLNVGNWYNKVYEKEVFVTVYDRLWQKTWKDGLSILWLLYGELHTNIWSIWHGSLRLITSFVVDDMLMKHLYEWHEWFACQEMYTRFQEDIIYDTLVDCKSHIRISFHK